MSKAYLINPEKKEMTEISVNNIYDIEDIIGSEIDIVYEFVNGDLMYADSNTLEFDDEDALENHNSPFLFYMPIMDFPIPGKAVITGPLSGTEKHYPPGLSVDDNVLKQIYWISEL